MNFQNKMIELKKGDSEKLEGKVIVYSRLNCPDSSSGNCSNNGRVFAMYATDNSDDFAKRVKSSREVLEESDDNHLQKIKEGLLGLLGIKLEHVNIYAAPIHIDSEEELLQSEEDVVFAGEYSCPQNCMNAVKTALDFYVLRLMDQMIRASKTDNPCEEDKQQPQKTYQEDFESKDPNGRRLKAYLMDTYINPMINTKGKGKFKRLAPLKQDFERFGQGTQFVSDISNICRLMERNMTLKNLNLIGAYVSKLVAVHAEDFETAAKLRDQIAELTKKK